MVNLLVSFALAIDTMLLFVLASVTYETLADRYSRAPWSTAALFVVTLVLAGATAAAALLVR